MAKLTATTFVTLDGVYQAPGGTDEDTSGGFDLGGWVAPFYEDAMRAYVTEWFSQAGSFLLGRRTYEIFAQFWPKVTDPEDVVATRLNSLPKYVASRTLSTSDWEGTRFIAEDVVSAVRTMKASPGPEIQVHGSGDLLQTLIAHDLVDEYRLWIYPVVLGKGRRLLTDGLPPKKFKHVETRTTSTGVNVLVLRANGTPDFESFGLPD